MGWGGTSQETERSLHIRVILSAVEIRAQRGSNSALHYSGSTLSEVTNHIADPQNAMRFDFTKSAICRRFCKVRLRVAFAKRMLQDRHRVFRLAVLFCISSSVGIADTFSAGEGFFVCSFARKVKYVVRFCNNNQQSSPSWLSDARPPSLPPGGRWHT